MSVAVRRPALRPRTIDDVYDAVTALRELMERIEQLLLPATPSRQWLSIEETAALTTRTPQAVRRWCRVYDIGVSIVDKVRSYLFLRRLTVVANLATCPMAASRRRGPSTREISRAMW
jgi:hypothetical protein